MGGGKSYHLIPKGILHKEVESLTRRCNPSQGGGNPSQGGRNPSKGGGILHKEVAILHKEVERFRSNGINIFNETRKKNLKTKKRKRQCLQ